MNYGLSVHVCIDYKLWFISFRPSALNTKMPVKVILDTALRKTMTIKSLCICFYVMLLNLSVSDLFFSLPCHPTITLLSVLSDWLLNNWGHFSFFLFYGGWQPALMCLTTTLTEVADLLGSVSGNPVTEKRETPWKFRCLRAYVTSFKIVIYRRKERRNWRRKCFLSLFDLLRC